MITTPLITRPTSLVATPLQRSVRDLRRQYHEARGGLQEAIDMPPDERRELERLLAGMRLKICCLERDAIVPSGAFDLKDEPPRLRV